MDPRVTKRQFASLIPAALISISGCSKLPEQLPKGVSGSVENTDGEIKWITESEGYLPIFIQKLGGDRYLTGGKYYLTDAKYENVWHGILNAEGELISEVIRDDIQGAWYSGTPMPDGGFALTGTVHNNEANGMGAPRVARYDENGDEVWSEVVREHPSSGDSTGECIVEIDDGHLVIIGEKAGDAVVMTKISPDGSVVWNRIVYEGPNDPPASPERLLVHDGAIIAGLSGSFENPSVLVAMDPSGNELWRQRMEEGGVNIAMKGNDIFSARADSESEETVVSMMNTEGTNKWETTLSKYYGGPISRYGDLGLTVLGGAGKRMWVGTFTDEGEMTADAIYGSATAKNKIIADTVIRQDGDQIACGNIQEGNSIIGWWGRLAKPKPQTTTES